MAHTVFNERTTKLRYKGVFDYDGLLNMIHGWLMKNHFYNFTEDVNKNKMPEFEKRWTAFYKRTGYIQEWVTFEAHFWGMKKVEKNGKQLWEGRGEMVFGWRIDTDWEGKWEKSQFWVRMRDWFDKHVIRKKLLFEYADPLENKVNGLVKDVKHYLGMEAE